MLQKETDDRKVLRACLREQAKDISARLKHRRLGAHTVRVKVRLTVGDRVKMEISPYDLDKARITWRLI